MEKKHTSITARLNYETASKEGKPVIATISGMEYPGFIHDGYFFQYVPTIGTTKLPVIHCDSVRELEDADGQ